MTLEIARFMVALTISWSPVTITADVDVTLMLRTEIPVRVVAQLPGDRVPALYGVGGFAIPHLIVVDSRLAGHLAKATIEHELLHAQQLAALGPALPLAYVLTLGRPFEDYLGQDMWMPPANMLRNCPLIRFTPAPVWMPCWRL